LNTDVRLAEQDFGFTTELVHDLDVKTLDEKIKEVENWHQNDNVRNEYLAPLFPIIQSSGTGKSRLLHSIRHLPNREKSTRLILLHRGNTPSLQKEDSYDGTHCVPGKINEKNRTNEKSKIITLITELCEKIEGNRCLLLFDEAQHLIGKDGFLLRVIRWVTRQKNFEVTREGNRVRIFITVVLAGTNSALANFFPEGEESVSLRGSRTLDPENFFTKGKTRFQPFFHIRTMGCLAKKN